MAAVVTIPTGGLSREMGTIKDQLLDIEQHRLGAASSFVASASWGTGSTWSTPVGAPTVTAAINATGQAFVLGGMSGNSGSGWQMGISIDGATPTIKGESNFASSQCVWVQQGLSMGLHTFTLQVMLTSSPGSSIDLFVVVIPV